MDLNDNSPVFKRNQYTARLHEDALVGKRILQVEAEDGDSGYNSQIQYKIVPSVNSSFFHIDRYTGQYVKLLYAYNRYLTTFEISR